MPGRWIAVHQLLHAHEVARRPSLDQIAGDGERTAAESDERALRLELAADDPHRLQYRLEGRRIRHAQPLDVGRRRDRRLDHRPDPLHELDADPHAENGGHDVREEHRRVDAVPAHRLQRHLGAELGRLGDLEERVALAERAVLGQRAPGLAHEPHRRALDLLAAQRANEERIGHGRRLAPECRPPPPMPSRPARSASAGSVRARPAAGGHARARARQLRERRARRTGTASSPPTTGSTTSATRSTGTGCARRCRPLAPGDEATAELEIRAADAAGPYRLAFDLVLEHRYWLSEIGNELLEVDVEVIARDASRRRRAPPAGGRARDRLARARPRGPRGGLHGRRRRDREPPARAPRLPPGGGRNPSFPEPLVCPSLLPPLEPNCEVAGLPAWRPEGWEPWIYDGRIVARC